MKNIINISILVLCFQTLIGQNQVNTPIVNINPNCITTPIDITIIDSIEVVPPVIIPPIIFVGCGGPNEDMDGDGIINSLDPDIDGDGIKNDAEDQFTDDMDGDGVSNRCDLDSDGDQVLDENDLCYAFVGVIPTGCPATITERNVFWVHGYQGNSNSLVLPGGDAAGRYKINSRYPDYNASQTSLGNCADNLRGDINDVINGAINTDKNFIIAHSMGGLVTRVLGDMTNAAGKPAYDGVITLGTPHLGAAAANTLVGSPATINNYLTKACKDLAAGPVDEAINNTGVLGRLAVTFGLAGGVLNSACDAGVGVGFPLITSFLSTGLEGQLTTAAASSLPTTPTKNKAAFYGIEQDDSETLTPRFIGAGLNSANGFPLYGADASDGLGITLVNNELNNYVSKYNFWDDQSAPFWLWLACSPCAIADEIRYNNLTNAWEKGVDWFPTLNPTWKDLIGALDMQVYQAGCQCDYYDYGNLTGTQIFYGDTDCESLESGNMTSSVECQPYYEIYTNTKTSDAFILAESAMNMPGVNYPVQVMEGSNHLQMRNDGNMGDAVNLIFNNGIDGRQYFMTDPR